MGFGSIFHRKKKPSSPTSSTTSPNGSRHSHVGSSAKNILIPADELAQVFKRFDVNGDGKISASELGSIMSSLGHAPTDEELDKMMREIDSDGDGFIDYNEFVELNTKGVDSDEILENLKDAFSVYDIDGNGSITAEELYEVLRSLGDDCTIAECKKMISGVDSDGDGTIDFEEFKVMMMMGSRYEFGAVERQVAI
ncbi:Calcium-binding protein [Melia azedarach]|uniref:Calcium-binding protein n=1 Tax=Melia azedarach TaxID=155640 RepID=A0ACC1XGV6_MELAZ|nr:Calcium-binding protein [Melia azedarach]